MNIYDIRKGHPLIRVKLMRVYIEVKKLLNTSSNISMQTLARACGYDVCKCICNEVNILVELKVIAKQGQPGTAKVRVTKGENYGYQHNKHRLS